MQRYQTDAEDVKTLMPKIVGRADYRPERAQAMITTSRELPEYRHSKTKGIAVIKDNPDAMFSVMSMIHDISRADSALLPLIEQLPEEDRLDSVLRTTRRLEWHRFGSRLYNATFGPEGHIEPGQNRIFLRLRSDAQIREILNEHWGLKLRALNFVSHHQYVFFAHQFEFMTRHDDVRTAMSELAAAYPAQLNMGIEDIKMRLFRMSLLNHALPPEHLKEPLRTIGGLTDEAANRDRGEYLLRMNLWDPPYSLYKARYIPLGHEHAFDIAENCDILNKARAYAGHGIDPATDTKQTFILRSY